MELSRCYKCGAVFDGPGNECPACRRNQEMDQAAQQRHREAMAAQEETQALIEEQMERARTENCLLCGTPVHTGEGSGFYHPECYFTNTGWDAVRAARAGKLSKSVVLRNTVHVKGPVPCSVDFVPDAAVWAALKPLLDDYERDCSESSASQYSIGPYCSQKCFDEAKATDPRFAKADEDRARIKEKWERLSSMPEWSAFLESFEAAKARLDALGKKTEEGMRARERRISEESRKKNAKKNLLVFAAIAIAAVWFLWLRPHRDERKAEAKLEEMARQQELERAETEEKSACLSNQFKLQNTLQPGLGGKPEKPLSEAPAGICPGGGTLTLELVPETWTGHLWNPQIPVLYRISCSKHGSASRPTPESIGEMVEYAKTKTPSVDAKKTETLSRLFDKDRIRGVLAAKTVADASSGKKLDVDPYSKSASATVKVSVDKAAYDAWTKKLLAALGPLAVERKKAKAKWTKGPLASSPEELGFDRPDRGRPLWIVKDAATLDADLLLFDDETWDAIIRLVGKDYEFHASLALKDDAGEVFAEAESAMFPGLVVVESWNSSAPAAYSIRPFLGGENGSKTEESKKAPIRFEKLESGRSAKKLSSGVTLKRGRGGWNVINDVPTW